MTTSASGGEARHVLGGGTRPASLDGVLAAVVAVPLRFHVLAGVWAVLILASHSMTPWHPFVSNGNPGTALFFARLAMLAGVLLAAAPVVALWRSAWATGLAVLPLALALMTNHVWPFTVFMALLAAMMTGVWRSRLLALVPGGVALGLVLVLHTGRSTLLVMDGSFIKFDGVGWSDLLVTFGMYVAAVVLAYGLALWMRSSALQARRLHTLDARAGAVEDRASVVEERARLARDLHDVVAHHVSLIAVRAETAPYTSPDLSSDARAVLAEIAGDARSALDELRGVLGVLRRSDGVDGDAAPAELAPQPDLAGVAALVDRVRAAGVEVRLDGDLRAPVSGPVGYVAYRVVQEALTNARRHAPGSAVTVAVLGEGDRLRVRVANRYLDQTSAAGGGSGLVGMRERVEALGGRLAAGVEGDLFVVEADLPRAPA